MLSKSLSPLVSHSPLGPLGEWDLEVQTSAAACGEEKKIAFIFGLLRTHFRLTCSQLASGSSVPSPCCPQPVTAVGILELVAPPQNRLSDVSRQNAL